MEAYGRPITLLSCARTVAISNLYTVKFIHIAIDMFLPRVFQREKGKINIHRNGSCPLPDAPDSLMQVSTILDQYLIGPKAVSMHIRRGSSEPCLDQGAHAVACTP